MRQIHRAGEKLFVDFDGPTLPLTTGRRAHIFVAAMGESGGKTTGAYRACANLQLHHGREL